mgnify:CR=1 FL=1
MQKPHECNNSTFGPSIHWVAPLWFLEDVHKFKVKCVIIGRTNSLHDGKDRLREGKPYALRISYGDTECWGKQSLDRMGLQICVGGWEQMMQLGGNVAGV